MIAKTTNLNLFYGKKQALFDINMQIEQNKITALIGASGCGKSTFLRCFNRMNDKIAKIDGLVEIEGKECKVIDLNTRHIMEGKIKNNNLQLLPVVEDELVIIEKD